MNATIQRLVNKHLSHKAKTDNTTKHSTKTSVPKEIKTIEEKNPVMMIDVIAESVIQEASVLLRELNSRPVEEYLSSDKPVKYLVERAETIYAHNPRFRKGVDSNANHGNAGRDYLVGFMRHWLSGEIRKASHENSKIRQILERSGFSWYGYRRPGR
jgi:hypothetical protein